MKKILLLLCKGVEIYEAAAFFDVSGWSGAYGAEAVEVVTVGLEKEVRGAFGIKIVPDRLLPEIKAEDFDALAVPGGFETYGYYEEGYCEPVAGLIRRFEDTKKPIASICVGALPLGSSGILKGRRATTYHLYEGLRRKQLAGFGATVVDEPIVRDGNIITSTSPATAMDVAFELLAIMTGKANSATIRQKMGFRAQISSLETTGPDASKPPLIPRVMQEEDADKPSIRMTQRGNQPSDAEVADWVGEEAYVYCKKVTRLIERDYPGVFAPEWLFGGRKHGWTLRYKKNKSFCTLIPEKDRFAVVIVFGAEERAKVEAVKDQLSARTRKEYDEASTYRDGKWVLLTINTDEVVEDVMRLLALKRRPKNHQARGSACGGS